MEVFIIEGLGMADPGVMTCLLESLGDQGEATLCWNLSEFTSLLFFLLLVQPLVFYHAVGGGVGGGLGLP